MNNNIQKKFNKIIQTLIHKYQIHSILIAFSGGQDSISLLHLINNFYKNNFYIIHIGYIYIDHKWRKDSEKQIEHMINYLHDTNHHIYIYEIPTNKIPENLSRIYRYHIMINHAIKYNFNTIITAHTKTDKIETFLQNLIRTTSIEGATSLNIHRRINNNINIFRPLLFINRIQTNFLCRQYNLPIWSDLTNYNYYIQRNRIRNELIPYFTKYINYQSEKNINYFLRTCYYDNEYIKQKAIKLYINNKNINYIALNYKNIINTHINIQIRTFQLFIFHNFCFFLDRRSLKIIINIINNTHNIHQFIIKKKYIKIYIKNKWIYIKLYNLL